MAVASVVPSEMSSVALAAESDGLLSPVEVVLSGGSSFPGLARLFSSTLGGGALGVALFSVFGVGRRGGVSFPSLLRVAWPPAGGALVLRASAGSKGGAGLGGALDGGAAALV